MAAAEAVYLRHRYCTCRIKNNDKPYKSDKGARKQREAIIILCVWTIVLFFFLLLFVHDGRIKYRVNTNRKPDDDITSAANETLRFERDKDVRDGKEKREKYTMGFER